MTNPKVSIVIPVYNGSNYLKEAIDSALAQTYKNIEIIVVNDGSNDNGATEEIAKSYGNKIKYYSKKNGGVASALNLGIKKMTGDYFSWLSHDDLYTPHKVSAQVECIVKFEYGTTIVASNAKTLFENGLTKKDAIHRKTFQYIDVFLATSARVGLNGCTLLIPRELLVRSSGFNEELSYTQDYDLWFRLRDVCKFILLDDALVISRRHKGQDSVQKQAACNRAADDLHRGFLDQIPQARFEEYLSSDKSNVSHTLKNYRLYSSRGMQKTASRLLEIVLGHLHAHDRRAFRRLFAKEVDIANVEGTASEPDAIYLELVKQGVAGDLPMRVRTEPLPRTNGLVTSIKEGGIVFTANRAVRKVRSIVGRRTN